MSKSQVIDSTVGPALQYLPKLGAKMSFTAIRSIMRDMQHMDITPCAKLVLVALANRHNQETGRCDPSISTIAKDLGISQRSVQNGLRELEKAKAVVTIERKARTGRGKLNMTNRYRISGGAEFACGVVQNLHPKLEDNSRPQKARNPSAFDDLAMSIEDLSQGSENHE